jgi:hypothetical protein
MVCLAIHKVPKYGVYSEMKKKREDTQVVTPIGLEEAVARANVGNRKKHSHLHLGRKSRGKKGNMYVVIA